MPLSFPQRKPLMGMLYTYLLIILFKLGNHFAVGITVPLFRYSLVVMGKKVANDKRTHK